MSHPGMGGRSKKKGSDMCPMMARMPVVGVKPTDLPAPESKAAKLYARYCSQCHALPSPKMHSAEEWKEAFDKMNRRMQMMNGMMMGRMSAPSPGEAEIILDYLRRHGLKGIRDDALPEGPAEGKTLFRETCSRCHALPDPRQHPPEEWPAIVGRMAQNMKSMNVPPPAAESLHRIKEYLEAVANFNPGSRDETVGKGR